MSQFNLYRRPPFIFTRSFNFTSILPPPDTANLTTYPFSNVATGAAGLCVVGAVVSHSSVGTRVITQIDIDGSAGTLEASGAGFQPCAMAWREIGAGPIDIDVTTTSPGFQNCAIAVWMLRNFSSATAHDQDSLAQGAATSINRTFNIPAGGAAFLVSGHFNNNTTTWSSASEITDVAVETTRFAAAEIDNTTGGAVVGTTETVSWSGANSNSMAVVSFS